jgi:hypothetical protein
VRPDSCKISKESALTNREAAQGQSKGRPALWVNAAGSRRARQGGANHSQIISIKCLFSEINLLLTKKADRWEQAQKRDSTMDSVSRTGTSELHTLYRPQTDENGCACVIVSRPDGAAQTLSFHSKEAACFWARQWMRRDRLARLESLVFGSAWIGSRKDH